MENRFIINDINRYKEIKENTLTSVINYSQDCRDLVEIDGQGQINFIGERTQRNLRIYINLMSEVRVNMRGRPIDYYTPNIYDSFLNENSFILSIIDEIGIDISDVSNILRVPELPRVLSSIVNSFPRPDSYGYDVPRTEVSFKVSHQKINPKSKTKLKIDTKKVLSDVSSHTFTSPTPLPTPPPPQITIVERADINDLANQFDQIKKQGKDITDHVKFIIEDEITAVKNKRKTLPQAEDIITDNIAAYIFKQTKDNKIDNHSTKANIKFLLKRDGSIITLGRRPTKPISKEQQLIRAQKVQQKVDGVFIKYRSEINNNLIRKGKETIGKIVDSIRSNQSIQV
jgi:hypothetical protein